MIFTTTNSMHFWKGEKQCSALNSFYREYIQTNLYSIYIYFWPPQRMNILFLELASIESTGQFFLFPWELGELRYKSQRSRTFRNVGTRNYRLLFTREDTECWNNSSGQVTSQENTDRWSLGSGPFFRLLW